MHLHPEIIVLAAGKGSRMNSHLPKPLHPIGGRPMLHHVLSTAAKLYPTDVRVVVSPDDALTAPGVAPVHTVIQPIARGTGDAVKCALEDFDSMSGTALVLFGDAPLIRETTLRHLLDIHAAQRNAVSVVAFNTDAPGTYGRLVLDAEERLVRIVEAKDASKQECEITLCNGGIMALDLATARDLLFTLSNDNEAGELYLTDVVAAAAAEGMTCGYIVADEQETLGANDRNELATLEQLYQARRRADVLCGGATLQDPGSVFLSWDTIIEPDVVVEPNVVFGPGVRVRSNAVIRAYSYLEQADVSSHAVVGPYARLRPGARIGEAAKVGNFVEIKNSEIAEGAKVPHLSYIGDSEVGPRANIGAGTITCNYDGFSKHRTYIGAEAFIGSNTALVAPVDVGPQAIVGAGSTITRDVPSQALVIARGEARLKPFGGAVIRERNTQRRACAGDRTKREGLRQ